MFRSYRNTAFLLLALAVAVPAHSQAPLAESIEVSIANLDVVVLDRHGKPVQGLTKKDFEVLEDGKKQEITNFAEYTSPDVKASPLSRATARAGAAAPAERPRRDRFIAIVVDIQDIDRMRRDQFFKGLREFIDREQRPNDQTAIFVWTKRLLPIVPPTSDRAVIDAALTSFQKTPNWNEREVVENLKAESIIFAQEIAEMTGNESEGAVEKEFQEMLLGEERCAYMKRKYEALREVIASYGALDMQKILILGSDDLSIRPEPSCLLQQNVESLAVIANTYGFTINAYHPPGARTKAQPADGNYAIETYRFPNTNDPPPNSGADQLAWEESNALSLLAKQTGGDFAVGAPLAVKSLETVSATLDNYYSIAYRLEGGRVNQARQVVVRVKDRSMTVRARKSVVALSDDLRIKDAVLSGLYSSAKPKSAIPVLAEVDEAKRDGTNVRLKITLSVPLEKLTLLPDEKGNVTGRFEVYAGAGRNLGDASSVSRLEQQFTRPAKIEPGERFEYTFDLVVRATTKRVALAVRDGVTKEYGIATVEVKLPGS